VKNDGWLSYGRREMQKELSQEEKHRGRGVNQKRKDGRKEALHAAVGASFESFFSLTSLHMCVRVRGCIFMRLFLFLCDCV